MAERTYVSARTTQSDDFKSIEDLVARAHLGGELWALSWTPDAVASEIVAAHSWIARDSSGRRLGFAFVRPPGASWEITLVVVSGEHRGSGVFTALLASIKEQAKGHVVPGCDASFHEMDLEVRADNHGAIRAYEANGFVQVGRRKGYYLDGADALLYRLKI